MTTKNLGQIIGGANTSAKLAPKWTATMPSGIRNLLQNAKKLGEMLVGPEVPGKESGVRNREWPSSSFNSLSDNAKRLVDGVQRMDLGVAQPLYVIS